MRISIRRCLGGLLAPTLLGVLAVAGFAVPAAQASVPAPGACDNAVLTLPFLGVGDSNYYKLVPGGDFEGSHPGWTLTGAAAILSGSAPAGAGGSVGSSSLRLSSGATAQSPSTCVNAAYPSLRFFARADTPGSRLSVSVVYPALLGTVAIPVGAVAPGASWAPTAAMPTLSAIALLSGGTASVQLRFTELTGSSRVDSVYIDPHTMH